MVIFPISDGSKQEQPKLPLGRYAPLRLGNGVITPALLTFQTISLFLDFIVFLKMAALWEDPALPRPTGELAREAYRDNIPLYDMIFKT